MGGVENPRKCTRFILRDRKGTRKIKFCKARSKFRKNMIYNLQIYIHAKIFDARIISIYTNVSLVNLS